MTAGWEKPQPNVITRQHERKAGIDNQTLGTSGASNGGAIALLRGNLSGDPMNALIQYMIAAPIALFVGYCFLKLLARFFEWLDWMELPASERAALRAIERRRK